MDKLLFGTGGVPRSSRSGSTVAGIERIAELGLGCMEVEFVQGVRMSETGAIQVAKAAGKRGIRLTVHASYFINLNAHEPEKIRASQQRLLQSARVGKLCGAESVAFHTAFYLGDPLAEVYERVKHYLAEVLGQLKRENNRLWMRPELLGKDTQFGTLEELLNLSAELEGVAPCIDFAHCHARSGKFNSYPEFVSVLEHVRKRLGREALESLHLHVSGIAYSKKAGEKKHMNMNESDFQYADLMRALKDTGARGFVICESPNLEEDALLLQETYAKGG